MKKIDISTEEKKKEVYETFASFKKKGDIFVFYGISDNKAGIEYVNSVAKEVGFDFSYYRNKKRKFCLQCGKELKPGQRQFCSRSCSATFNNKKRGYQKDETKKRISKTLKNKEKPLQTVKCAYCGKEFLTANKNRKYCSNQCQADSIKEETVKKWKDGGKVTSGANNKLPQSVREYIFEQAQYCCEECGFSGFNKKTGKTILQIHHIDGDSKNCKPENLKVLCPNCHALTDNYMGLNKGQSTRNKRYK